MSPETTIAELLTLWPRLPGLAGAQWPTFYWQLVDLLRAFRRAANDEQRAGVAIRVQRLLASVPEVRAAWRTETAGLERGEGMLTRGGAFSAPVARDEVWAGVEELLRPEMVTRWTDVLVPGKVRTGQRFAVVVGLTCQGGTGDEAKPIAVAPGQTVRSRRGRDRTRGHGRAGARDSRCGGSGQRAGGVLLVRAAAGEYGLMLDFWVHDELVAGVAYRVVAEDASAGPGMAATRPGLPVAVGSARVPHPDLILRVTTADNRLRFDLDFADTRFVQIEGPRLRTDPETFRYELLKEIEGLAAEKGKPQDFLARQLDKIGQRLYRELVSGGTAARVSTICGRGTHVVSESPTYMSTRCRLSPTNRGSRGS